MAKRDERIPYLQSKGVREEQLPYPALEGIDLPSYPSGYVPSRFEEYDENVSLPEPSILDVVPARTHPAYLGLLVTTRDAHRAQVTAIVTALQMSENVPFEHALLVGALLEKHWEI